MVEVIAGRAGEQRVLPQDDDAMSIADGATVVSCESIQVRDRVEPQGNNEPLSIGQKICRFFKWYGDGWSNFSNIPGTYFYERFLFMFFQSYRARLAERCAYQNPSFLVDNLEIFTLTNSETLKVAKALTQSFDYRGTFLLAETIGKFKLGVNDKFDICKEIFKEPFSSSELESLFSKELFAGLTDKQKVEIVDLCVKRDPANPGGLGYEFYSEPENQLTVVLDKLALFNFNDSKQLCEYFFDLELKDSLCRSPDYIRQYIPDYISPSPFDKLIYEAQNITTNHTAQGIDWKQVEDTAERFIKTLHDGNFTASEKAQVLLQLARVEGFAFDLVDREEFAGIKISTLFSEKEEFSDFSLRLGVLFLEKDFKRPKIREYIAQGERNSSAAYKGVFRRILDRISGYDAVATLLKTSNVKFQATFLEAILDYIHDHFWEEDRGLGITTEQTITLVKNTVTNTYNQLGMLLKEGKEKSLAKKLRGESPLNDAYSSRVSEMSWIQQELGRLLAEKSGFVKKALTGEGDIVRPMGDGACEQIPLRERLDMACSLLENNGIDIFLSGGSAKVTILAANPLDSQRNPATLLNRLGLADNFMDFAKEVVERDLPQALDLLLIAKFSFPTEGIFRRLLYNPRSNSLDKDQVNDWIDGYIKLHPDKAYILSQDLLKNRCPFVNFEEVTPSKSGMSYWFVGESYEYYFSHSAEATAFYRDIMRKTLDQIASIDDDSMLFSFKSYIDGVDFCERIISEESHLGPDEKFMAVFNVLKGFQGWECSETINKLNLTAEKFALLVSMLIQTNPKLAVANMHYFLTKLRSFNHFKEAIKPNDFPADLWEILSKEEYLPTHAVVLGDDAPLPKFSNWEAPLPSGSETRPISDLLKVYDRLEASGLLVNKEGVAFPYSVRSGVDEYVRKIENRSIMGLPGFMNSAYEKIERNTRAIIAGLEALEESEDASMKEKTAKARAVFKTIDNFSSACVAPYTKEPINLVLTLKNYLPESAALRELNALNKNPKAALIEKIRQDVAEYQSTIVDLLFAKMDRSPGDRGMETHRHSEFVKWFYENVMQINVDWDALEVDIFAGSADYSEEEALSLLIPKYNTLSLINHVQAELEHTYLADETDREVLDEYLMSSDRYFTQEATQYAKDLKESERVLQLYLRGEGISGSQTEDVDGMLKNLRKSFKDYLSVKDISEVEKATVQGLKDLSDDQVDSITKPMVKALVKRVRSASGDGVSEMQALRNVLRAQKDELVLSIFKPYLEKMQTRKEAREKIAEIPAKLVMALFEGKRIFNSEAEKDSFKEQVEDLFENMHFDLVESLFLNREKTDPTSVIKPKHLKLIAQKLLKELIESQKSNLKAEVCNNALIVEKSIDQEGEEVQKLKIKKKVVFDLLKDSGYVQEGDPIAMLDMCNKEPEREDNDGFGPQVRNALRPPNLVFNFDGGGWQQPAAALDEVPGLFGGIGNAVARMFGRI